MKKLLAFMLAVLICVTFISPNIYAATIKLNKTKITIDEGKSYTLKVSGTKETVKWSTSNKKIATVSTKGVVKGVKEGTATITAAVNKKKLTCKVTVKDVLTEKEAAKNISYELTETNDRLVVELKNNNKVSLYAKVNVTYLDENGDMLSTQEDGIYTFQANKEAALTFSYPHDSNYNKVDYSDIEVSISVSLNSFMTNKGYVDDISIKSNKGSNGVVAKITNNSDEDMSTIHLTVLYYVGDTIVGTSHGYVFGLSSGDTATDEFLSPYDNNFDKINYDSYKIVINQAY